MNRIRQSFFRGHAFRGAGWLLVLALLTQCDNPDDALPAQSRILQLILPGVPPEAVSINQERLEITLSVPTDLTAAQLRPTFELACDDCDVVPSVVNPCDTAFAFSVVSPQAAVPTAYRVRFRPIGALAIGPLAAPLEGFAEQGGVVALPVQNFYDGLGATAVFTKKSNGEKVGGTVLCEAPNQVRAIPTRTLTPGEYTVELVKTNGRRAVAPQPFVVKKGLPAVYFDAYRPTLGDGTAETLRGANLFADDNIELRLRNGDGDEFDVKPTAFSLDGTRAVVAYPPVVGPGYYRVQLSRQGQPLPSYGRLVVVKNREQPYVIAVGDGLRFPSDDPVFLQRDKPYPLLFAPLMRGYSVRVRLVPVGNFAWEEAIDVVVPNAFWTTGPDAGTPSLTIPASVTPGQYQLVLQYVARTSSEVLESEPLERLVEVQ